MTAQPLLTRADGELEMPFRLGPVELILILVVLMLLFGVGKLPQVGQAMGNAVKQFRQSQKDIEGDDDTAAAKSDGDGADDGTKQTPSG